MPLLKMPLDYKFSNIKLKNEPSKTPCKNFLHVKYVENLCLNW